MRDTEAAPHPRRPSCGAAGARTPAGPRPLLARLARRRAARPSSRVPARTVPAKTSSSSNGSTSTSSTSKPSSPTKTANRSTTSRSKISRSPKTASRSRSDQLLPERPGRARSSRNSLATASWSRKAAGAARPGGGAGAPRGARGPAGGRGRTPARAARPGRSGRSWSARPGLPSSENLEILEREVVDGLAVLVGDERFDVDDVDVDPFDEEVVLGGGALKAGDCWAAARASAASARASARPGRSPQGFRKWGGLRYLSCDVVSSWGASGERCCGGLSLQTAGQGKAGAAVEESGRSAGSPAPAAFPRSFVPPNGGGRPSP